MNTRVINALRKEARVGKLTMLGRKLGLLKMPNEGLGFKNLASELDPAARDALAELLASRHSYRARVASGLKQLDATGRNSGKVVSEAVGDMFRGTASKYGEFRRTLDAEVEAMANSYAGPRRFGTNPVNRYTLYKLLRKGGAKIKGALKEYYDNNDNIMKIQRSDDLYWPGLDRLNDYVDSARQILDDAVNAGQITERIRGMFKALRGK